MNFNGNFELTRSSVADAIDVQNIAKVTVLTLIERPHEPDSGLYRYDFPRP
ncbi:MAG: hypothetical protein V3V10_03615 [Planctomycetota bacterium]